MHHFCSYARLRGPHFDVVIWKLFSQLQSRSQCVDKATMSRFHSSIHLKDKVLIGQLMSCEAVFHETLHPSPPETSSHRCSAGVPRWSQSFS